MRLDALITITIFILTVSYMLSLYVNNRLYIINREIESWKCAEIKAEEILGNLNSEVEGRIEVKFIYWNYTTREEIEGLQFQKLGCAYTYRIKSDGALVYVKVCPYRICKP